MTGGQALAGLPACNPEYQMPGRPNAWPVHVPSCLLTSHARGGPAYWLNLNLNIFDKVNLISLKNMQEIQNHTLYVHPFFPGPRCPWVREPAGPVSSGIYFSAILIQKYINHIVWSAIKA